MPAFTVSKRATAPAAGPDQDPAAPTAWQLPGSLTRKVILSALIGYFLLVPAITGLVQHVTPATVFVTAGTVAFAGLVGWRVVLRDRPGLGGVPWAWLAVIVALAVAVFAVGRGPGWLIILTVAAAACGRFTASVRPALLGAASCSGAGLIVIGLQARAAEAETMTLVIIMPSMAAFLAYASTKRNETLAELRQTRAELARVAVAGERLRIARDLHDLLGHSLSLITLKAELSRRMLDTDTTSAAREMAELEAVARQSLSDVREAVAGYRQPDLIAELGAARQLLAAAGLSCQISTPADLSLPAGVDTVLAWTVREGVTNVVRHARATCAGVTVTTADGRVIAEITDNGTGPLAGPAGRAGRAQRAGPPAGREPDGRPGPGGRLPAPGHHPDREAAVTIRIMIAEDQAMVRQALVALLGLEPDIEVVAQAATGDEALAMAGKHQPDVAVLDIEMPGPSGIDVARQLRQDGFGGQVVIVTTFGRPGYLRAAMAAGASGFLLKDAPAVQLAQAIRRVAAGERVVDPALAAAALAEGESPLTVRETDVLAAAANHDAISEIAGRLHLSPGTVRNHLSAAMQKLGARNRAEAVQMAQRKGWL